MDNTSFRAPVQCPVGLPVERNEIAKALFKAQSLLQPLRKTESNPLYGSKYADLAGVLEAIKNALKEAGIVLIQGANVYFQTGTGNIMDQTTVQVVSVQTVLMHADSGQSVDNILNMLPVPDIVSKDHNVRAITPQTVGKTITYARRYALQALLGLAAEDDDANTASQPVSQPAKHNYKLSWDAITGTNPPEPIEKPEGMSETSISGKLSNYRNKTYQDGAIVHFFNLGSWVIWTKEINLMEELNKNLGAFITVIGKHSKTKANMFEALQWRGLPEETEQESE